MKAKTGTRFLQSERTKLEEVIPLDTPLLLFIDPSSCCNFKCVFCPCGGGNKEQWSGDKKVNILSYELYREIIDQMAEFPKKIKTLRLYKEGEPLLNKRLPDMIYYARKKNVAERIDFTTNGALLNQDLNFALLDAGIDRINISIEALDAIGYQKNAGVRIDFDKFCRNIEHLYKNRGNCHILIKISDYGLGDNSKEDFYNIFGDMCDEIAVEHITPVWPEFNLDHVKDNFQQGIYGNQIRNIHVCPYLFYSICINSDGSVSSCFMDWNHKLLVGNVKDKSIVDIWNSPEMDQMRIEHLKLNRRKYATCAKCGQLAFGALDNIDTYREVLLQKIIEKNI